MTQASLIFKHKERALVTYVHAFQLTHLNVKKILLLLRSFPFCAFAEIHLIS